MRAGCRCENVVFVCLFVFCFCFGHAASQVHCAYEGCIVRTSIALPFIARFRCGFQRFFTRDCSFRSTTQFAYSSLGGATIAKSPKICRKVCSHHFIQKAEGFKKILLQQFRAETVDVHLYKNFSACHYIALTATVKFRMGSPKTAQNEQVCVHQKSYRK